MGKAKLRRLKFARGKNAATSSEAKKGRRNHCKKRSGEKETVRKSAEGATRRGKTIGMLREDPRGKRVMERGMAKETKCQVSSPSTPFDSDNLFKVIKQEGRLRETPLGRPRKKRKKEKSGLSSSFKETQLKNRAKRGIQEGRGAPSPERGTPPIYSKRKG